MEDCYLYRTPIWALCDERIEDEWWIEDVAGVARAGDRLDNGG